MADIVAQALFANYDGMVVVIAFYMLVFAVSFSVTNILITACNWLVRRSPPLPGSRRAVTQEIRRCLQTLQCRFWISPGLAADSAVAELVGCTEPEPIMTVEFLSSVESLTWVGVGALEPTEGALQWVKAVRTAFWEMHSVKAAQYRLATLNDRVVQILRAEATTMTTACVKHAGFVMRASPLDMFASATLRCRILSVLLTLGGDEFAADLAVRFADWLARCKRGGLTKAACLLLVARNTPDYPLFGAITLTFDQNGLEAGTNFNNFALAVALAGRPQPRTSMLRRWWLRRPAVAPFYSQLLQQPFNDLQEKEKQAAGFFGLAPTTKQN